MSNIYKLLFFIISILLLSAQVQIARSPGNHRINDISSKGFYAFNKGGVENFLILPKPYVEPLSEKPDIPQYMDKFIADDNPLSITILPSETTEMRRGDNLAFNIIVTNQNNQPVGGADVLVTDSLNNFNSYTDKTNGSGQASYTFRVPGSAPNGEYYVDFEASAQGYINSPAERRFVVVVSGTTVTENRENGIYASLSPNPASSVCNVLVCLDKAREVSVELYDLDGNRLISSRNQADAGETIIPVRLDKIQQGHYITKVTVGEENFNLKVVIIR